MQVSAWHVDGLSISHRDSACGIIPNKILKAVVYSPQRTIDVVDKNGNRCEC
jgi:hypothetical protein